MKKYLCPVCGYADLIRPPSNQMLCPSCGTQFGRHDLFYTYDELRLRWQTASPMGPVWHSTVVPRPVGWDWQAQLRRVEQYSGSRTSEVYVSRLFDPNSAAVSRPRSLIADYGV